jgi:hypothetical protein
MASPMQTIIILLLLENELIEISSVSANEYEKHLEIWTGDQQAGEDGISFKVKTASGFQKFVSVL